MPKFFCHTRDVSWDPCRSRSHEDQSLGRGGATRLIQGTVSYKPQLHETKDV